MLKQDLDLETQTCDLNIPISIILLVLTIATSMVNSKPDILNERKKSAEAVTTSRCVTFRLRDQTIHQPDLHVIPGDLKIHCLI